MQLLDAGGTESVLPVVRRRVAQSGGTETRPENESPGRTETSSEAESEGEGGSEIEAGSQEGCGEETGR